MSPTYIVHKNNSPEVRKIVDNIQRLSSLCLKLSQIEEKESLEGNLIEEDVTEKEEIVVTLKQIMEEEELSSTEYSALKEILTQRKNIYEKKINTVMGITAGIAAFDTLLAASIIIATLTVFLVFLKKANQKNLIIYSGFKF